METAAIIRNSIESWRGSPVRWLLDRVSEHLPRLPEPGDALLERSNRWQEEFWSSHRSATSAVPRRRQVVWTEQGELWPGEVVDEAPATAAKPAAAKLLQRAVETPHPRIRKNAAAMVSPAAVRRSATKSYADQPKSVRTADIARYLQVNSAVDGVKGTSWFEMPKRGSASAFDRSLWKGRPVGTPFVKGC